MPNNKKSMLIVDDDMHMRKMILTYAQIEGFQCYEAEDGSKALELFHQTAIDIVILDVMMPGIDGFETLTKIREESQVPVIMLTARSEEYDKLFGFNLGVDDYMVKPFSPKELMARVGAVLKRSGVKTADVYQFGEFKIELKSRKILIHDQPVYLPPKEFDLLIKLVGNEHIVLSRDKLLETVWGYDYYGDTRTLDTHIKSLREHLGEYRTLIKTVWGVGYKFESAE